MTEEEYRESYPGNKSQTRSDSGKDAKKSGPLHWINDFISRNSSLIKFGVVGASGIVVNEAVLFLLHSLGLNDVISQAIGVELSIINNFTWNDKFTFSKMAREKSRLARLTKYNLVSLVTFALNLAVFTFLTSIGWYYILASIVAIFVAFALNFLGSSRWAWAGSAANIEQARRKNKT